MYKLVADLFYIVNSLIYGNKQNQVWGVPNMSENRSLQYPPIFFYFKKSKVPQNFT